MKGSSKSRNVSLALSMAAIVVGMVMLAYASVPLYRLFCQVTGFGGTTQQAATIPQRVLDRHITVRFNTDVSPELPWKFRPVQNKVDVRVGEQTLVHFTARNNGDNATTGVATFNVTPYKAGPYFNKIQCFCFDNQPLEAGETADLPVSFFVDPALADDPDLDDVNTITLSYTFFPLKP